MPAGPFPNCDARAISALVMAASCSWTKVVGEVEPPESPRKTTPFVVYSTIAAVPPPPGPSPAFRVMLVPRTSMPPAVKSRSPVPSVPAWMSMVAAVMSSAIEMSPVEVAVYDPPATDPPCVIVEPLSVTAPVPAWSAPLLVIAPALSSSSS
jgi:hypothetical protein